MCAIVFTRYNSCLRLAGKCCKISFMISSINHIHQDEVRLKLARGGGGGGGKGDLILPVSIFAWILWFFKIIFLEGGGAIFLISYPLKWRDKEIPNCNSLRFLSCCSSFLEFRFEEKSNFLLKKTNKNKSYTVQVMTGIIIVCTVIFLSLYTCSTGAGYTKLG